MSKEKAGFVGTCVNGLEDEQFREYIAEDATLLAQLVEEGQKISKKTFIKNCFIEDEILENIKKYPHDYTFYRNGNIYFYTWSSKEHFYI